jgi:hypothetical protein
MSPRADAADFACTLVPLERPRALTPAERAILDHFAADYGSDALHEQVAQAEVVGMCECGCPSVELRSAADDVPTEEIREVADTEHLQDAQLRRWFMNRDGRVVDVTLHVVAGQLEELEVWSGWDGGETITELPGPELLRTGDPPADEARG